MLSSFLTNDFLFWLSTTLATASWLLLFILPKARVTEVVIHSGLMTGLISAIFAYELATLGNVPGGYGTLSELKLYAQTDRFLVSLWTHLQAFDLLVGSWMTKDARENKVPRLWFSFSLLALFLVGPIGFLLYESIKFYRRNAEKFEL